VTLRHVQFVCNHVRNYTENLGMFGAPDFLKIYYLHKLKIVWVVSGGLWV
jgi:hypothetical protein